MFVTGLHHVQLAMPRGREDDARAFYVGVLQFVEEPKPPERDRGGAWFRSGSAQVHLGVEDDFRPAKKAHPALLVGNLRALIERCEEAGYPITPGDAMTGFERAYVHDVFGNRIELLQPV